MKYISLIILFLFSFSVINANYSENYLDNLKTKKSYTSSDDFLAAEWHICKTATDGCNSISIWWWRLWIATEAYCEEVYWENGIKNFSCGEYNELIDLKYLDRLKNLENIVMKKISIYDDNDLRKASLRLDEMIFYLEISSFDLDYKIKTMTEYSFVMSLFNKKINIR